MDGAADVDAEGATDVDAEGATDDDPDGAADADGDGGVGDAGFEGPVDAGEDADGLPDPAGPAQPTTIASAKTSARSWRDVRPLKRLTL